MSRKNSFERARCRHYTLATCLLFIANLCSHPVLAAGAIYKWKDANGRVHIGDSPPDPSAAEQLSVRVNTYKSGSAGDVERPVIPSAKKVVIYTTARCGYCRKAKAYFTSKGVPYQEYDIEHSEKGQRDFKKLKGSGVPIILVGDQRLNGFSESRVGAALKKAGYSL